MNKIVRVAYSAIEGGSIGDIVNTVTDNGHSTEFKVNRRFELKQNHINIVKVEGYEDGFADAALKEIISDVQQKISGRIEDIIREYAKPKIKGEITEGKLKWRGVSMYKSFEYIGFNQIITYNIYQRGKFLKAFQFEINIKSPFSDLQNNCT